ncbi:glycosyltransferase family 2 protein [Roseivivax sp. CAU 1761]
MAAQGEATDAATAAGQGSAGQAAAGPRIGLTVVAARRPDLLRRTLDSFAERLFARVDLAWVRVNVDPIFGDAAAGEAVRALLAERFPGARVTCPESPGFGAAVKRLWTDLPDGPFLHLEDDWIANEPIDAPRALSWLDAEIKAVSLLSETHGPKGRGAFSEGLHKTKVFGITLRRTVVPRFGLSPSFFDGAFARHCAALMDPALDPEKQMRRPYNKAMTDHVERYRCRFLKAADGGPLVTDIGRDWQAERGIVKSVAEGTSTWTQNGRDG